MVIEVDTLQAEHDLSSYVEKALEGEEVIISSGTQAVRLVPIHHESPEFPNEMLAGIDDCELNHYLG